MKEPRKKADPDVVVLASPTEDGEGVHAVRARKNRVEIAEIRPLRDGQPIGAGEVVRLQPRENPAICDVEVVCSIDEQELEATTRPGPARVSSSRYRRNFDAVFGRKRSPGTLAN